MRLSRYFATISTLRLHIGGKYSSSDDSASREIMPYAENRSPFIFEHKDTCDAYQFVYGAEFFTNTSIFQYSITSIDGSEGFLYSKAPLSEICDLTQYNIKVDRAQRTVLNNVGLLHLPNNKYRTHKDRD
jgi:hypothetical protein